MSRGIEWGPVALVDLQRIHWRTAARVDEAVQHFAATGAGTLRYVDVNGERRLRLYVAPYFAWVSVTPEAVIVWRIIRYA